MRTEHLEYLVDLKETKSFTKTAEKFLTSHQVISKAIDNLEKELNVRILERTYRGVHFTQNGLTVYKHAKDILVSRQALLQEIAAKYGETLNVFIAPRFANDFFIDFYNEYQKENPKLQIMLKNISFSYIFNNAIDNNTVILLPMAQDTFNSLEFLRKAEEYSFVYETILEQPLGYCVSQNSLYYQEVLKFTEEPKSVRGKFPFSVVAHNYYTEENRLLTDDEKQFYLVDNFDIQKKMVIKGTHVAFLTPFEYKWLFQDDAQIKLLFSQYLESKFYYIALYKQADRSNENIRDFLTKLKEAIQQ